MNNWKWDGQHVLILAAYLAGFATVIEPYFEGKPMNGSTITGAVILLGSALFGFFTRTPKDAGTAFTQGEQVTPVLGGK